MRPEIAYTEKKGLTGLVRVIFLQEINGLQRNFAVSMLLIAYAPFVVTFDR